MDGSGAQNQAVTEAEASNTRRRGRKPTQTPEQRRAKKIKRDKDYRTRKNERFEALEKEIKEKQSEINFLKEENSKTNARADELMSKQSDLSKKLEEEIMAKERLESEVQQLQEKILNQRGRKPTQTPEQRRAKKIQRDKDFRKRKTEERKESEKRIEALEKEIKEKQSEINSQKEENSKMNARVDELMSKQSDLSKKLEEEIMAKERLESKVQQLQEKILNEEDLEKWDFSGIPMDYPYLYGYSMGDNTPNNFSHRQHPESSKGKGAEVVNVEGFTVLKENAIEIQEILRQYPKIASALKIHHPESINGLMNTLAEVYKIAREEKHTPEEIKRMEKGIQDLEFAGFKVSWLKTMVVKAKRMQRKA